MQNRFVCLGDLTPAQTTFLWQDRVPLGALTVLEGDAGSGKSTLLYDVAARLTKGRALPGATLVGGAAGVIFVQAEDNPARTILPTVQTCDGDPSRILVLGQASAKRPLRLPDNLADVESAITQIGAKLVVVDPLSDFASFNLNDDRAVRAGLRPLATIAQRNDIAVILVRHLRKTEHKSALHRGAGSVAIAAMARSVLVVGADPQSEDPNQHVLALSKSNVSTAPSLAFRTSKPPSGDGRVVEWLGESHLTADEILGGARQQGASALFEALDVLYSTLANCPVPAREVIVAAREAGVAERTLRRAKSVLQVRSKKLGTGADARWYWTLPDDERILRSWRDRRISQLCDQLVNGADGHLDIPGQSAMVQHLDT